MGGKATLRFLNPFNDEYEAVVMICNMTGDVEFELLHDFTLIGNVTNLTLTLTEYEAYFQTSENLADMTSKVESLADPFA